MRRDRGRRRIYRSRALRRRRSAFVLCVLAALAGVVLAAGQSRGSERVTYDRRAAAAYADTWALSTNPAYWSSPDDDCADFVSQCLAAGGLHRLAERGFAPDGRFDWRTAAIFAAGALLVSLSPTREVSAARGTAPGRGP